MKKIAISILSALMIFTVGCSKYNTDNNLNKPVEELSFDNFQSLQAAKEFIESFRNNDLNKMKSVVSKKLKDGLPISPDTSIKINGVRLEEATQKGLNAVYKYTISSNNPSEPFGKLENYYLKVEKEDGQYKVTSIKAVPEYEVFKERTALKIRKDGEVEINNIIKLKNIPNTAYPKANKGDITEVKIPRDDYGVIGISYHGDKIAITTVGENSTYVCLLEVDDAITTVAPSLKNNQQGDSNESDDEKDEDKVKLLGKKITTLDVLSNLKVEDFTFSKDDNYISVNYINSNGAKRFNLYKNNGDIIDLNLDQLFPNDKYSVIYKDSKESEVFFQVVENNGAIGTNLNAIGNYKISTKDFKLTKL